LSLPTLDEGSALPTLRALIDFDRAMMRAAARVPSSHLVQQSLCTMVCGQAAPFGRSSVGLKEKSRGKGGIQTKMAGTFFPTEFFRCAEWSGLLIFCLLSLVVSSQLQRCCQSPGAA
jgi:hypothetical protein